MFLSPALVVVGVQEVEESLVGCVVAGEVGAELSVGQLWSDVYGHLFF